MAKVRQLDHAQQRLPATDSPLTPELRDFIDRAIVPILVNQYLAERYAENELAKRDSDTAHSDSNTAAQELRTVRP